VASDEGRGSIVEAAVDDFEVYEGEFSPPALVEVAPAALATGPSGPVLLPNRPNPFRASTEIEYSIAREGAVELRVFDVAGRLVRSLVEAPLAPAGSHSIGWDGRDREGTPAASGVYLVRLRAGDRIAARRIVLLRGGGAP
jgi:hypothetical protein